MTTVFTRVERSNFELLPVNKQCYRVHNHDILAATNASASLSLDADLLTAELEIKVAVVEMSPSTNKRMLVRNVSTIAFAPHLIAKSVQVATEESMFSGAIYLISYKECGEEHIGETAGPLHLRITEHEYLDGKASSRLPTALEIHLV